MTMGAPMPIDDVLIRVDEIIDGGDAVMARGADADADAAAAELLTLGEAVLIGWLAAADKEPTLDQVEGFRLLALHRQGARGNPSFNACRETCREIVYHHNLVRHDPTAAETAQRLRVGAMVVRHLALFVSGKLQEAGLGDFCCSSRPVRQVEQPGTYVETV